MSNTKLREELITARRTLAFYQAAAMREAEAHGFARREAAQASRRIEAFKQLPLRRRLVAAWRNDL